MNNSTVHLQSHSPVGGGSAAEHGGQLEDTRSNVGLLKDTSRNGRVEQEHVHPLQIKCFLGISL